VALEDLERQIAGEVYWAGIQTMLDSRPKST
jgi:hypothetical protein